MFINKIFQVLRHPVFVAKKARKNACLKKKTTLQQIKSNVTIMKWGALSAFNEHLA